MGASQLGYEAAGKELLQKAFDLDPYFFFTRQILAGVHREENKFAEAITAPQEAVRRSGGLPATRGWEAFYLAVGGRRPEALEILDQLQQVSHERYVPATARACCYLGLGDHGRAITWLETGYEQRDSPLPHIAALRALKPLRPDPRSLAARGETRLNAETGTLTFFPQVRIRTRQRKKVSVPVSAATSHHGLAGRLTFTTAC